MNRTTELPRMRPAPIVIGVATLLLAGSGCTVVSGWLSNILHGTGGTTTSSFPRRTPWAASTISGSANGVRPQPVAIADFNSDGRADVVVGYQGDGATLPTVVIYFSTISNNSVNWTSIAPARIAQSAAYDGVAALAVADLDHDGKLDVIAAVNGAIHYLRSPTDPTQASQWQDFIIAQSDDAGIGQWSDVAVAQIDALNNEDIVAANSSTGRVSYFAAPVAPVPPATLNGTGWMRFDVDATGRAGASAVLVMDVDGDGLSDIVSAANGELVNSVAWYQNPGNNGVPVPWTKFGISNGRSYERLAVGDLDKDGLPDIVATNPNPLSAAGANDGIQIVWFKKPASPTTATTWTGHVLAQYNSNTPVDIRVADVDLNGNLDVIAATKTGGTLRWFSNRTDVTQTWIENNLADLGADVGRIAVGDIDLDARQDVVATLRATSSTSDSVNWYLNPE